MNPRALQLKSLSLLLKYPDNCEAVNVWFCQDAGVIVLAMPGYDGCPWEPWNWSFLCFYHIVSGEMCAGGWGVSLWHKQFSSTSFTVSSALLLSVWRSYLRTPGAGEKKNVYLKHNGCVEENIKSGVDDGFFHSYGVNDVVIVCTGEGVREQNKSLKGHRWCFVFIIKKV